MMLHHKYARPSEVCDVCGGFRYRKGHDHEACSKVRQARRDAWLDEPAGWRSNPTLTNRQAEAAKARSSAWQRKKLKAGNKMWVPDD